MDDTMKKITEKMERAYRLCSHDHKGLSVEQAANRMGVTPQAVSGLLNRMKEIAPQLFPILTKRQAQLWHLWHIEGWNFNQIAEHLKVSRSTVVGILAKCRKKLGYVNRPKRTKTMDPKKLENRDDIKEVF